MRAHPAKASVEQSLDGKPSWVSRESARPDAKLSTLSGNGSQGDKKAHGALAPRGNADELGFINICLLEQPELPSP
jgi:hypothetical protein